MARETGRMPYGTGRWRARLNSVHYCWPALNDIQTYCALNRIHSRQGTVPARKGNAAERECRGKGISF